MHTSINIYKYTICSTPLVITKKKKEEGKSIQLHV
jgi:hypothetical protein